MTIEEARKLVYDWHRQGGDSFTCHLFDLFMKADPVNKYKLKQTFPSEFHAWLEWYESPTPEEFYKKHGLGE